MPFLLPLVPALAGGVASAGAGIGLNALLENGSSKGSGFQAQSAPIQTPITGDQVTASGAPVQQGLTAEQQLINNLTAQQGINNQTQVYNQLQGVANGTGPNPAQALLNQATGQNVAAQGALAAGQRGAASNVGLLQRQAAQEGAATQQNAVGQGASLQANQSLNALNNLGGIANQQITNQANATNALNQYAQGNQGQLIEGLGNQNTAQVGNASQQNSANSGVATQNADTMGNAIGGIANGLGNAITTTLVPGTQPVPVKKWAGGEIENPKLAKVPKEDRFAKGGAVKSIPRFAYPKELAQLAAIYHGKHQNMFAGGEAVSIPGNAKVSGDSPKNDTVPAKLSPGEVVLPRSVMQARDPASAAAKFVAAIHKKEGKTHPENDFKQALRRAVQNRKLKAS